MECQEPPISEAEVLECFPSTFEIRVPDSTKLKCHIAI